MSPWCLLYGEPESRSANDKKDVLRARSFAYCTRKVLAGVPEPFHVYMGAREAPDSWFEGVDKFVERVLISAGDHECLRDDTRGFANRFIMHHGKTHFIVQENGVHNDPFYDFLVGERKPSELTLAILGWLLEGFESPVAGA